MGQFSLSDKSLLLILSNIQTAQHKHHWILINTLHKNHLWLDFHSSCLQDIFFFWAASLMMHDILNSPWFFCFFFQEYFSLFHVLRATPKLTSEQYPLMFHLKRYVSPWVLITWAALSRWHQLPGIFWAGLEKLYSSQELEIHKFMPIAAYLSNFCEILI